ncbi:MAG: translocation/assembly module TamB domain-containing protein [Burkholderiaceae bacterium]|jgi:translocation and assembly module TamB|nr:translocation/assembly module TamB domain-containing protein [Burkholderiaceae bacterium]
MATPDDTLSAPARAPRRKRWWRGGILLLEVLALLAAAALMALWLWSGSAGSLRQALGWAQAWLPPGALTVENVTGAIRGQGAIGHVRYSGGGLDVAVTGAQYDWDARALWSGAFRLKLLAAHEIRIDYAADATRAATPAGGPPAPLAWALLDVVIERFAVDQLTLERPAPLTLQAIEGRYQFAGNTHTLALDHLRCAQGDWSAHLRLDNTAEARLDASAQAQLQTPALPPDLSAIPLALQARLQGPLADLQLRASLGVLPASGAAAAPSASASAASPQASLSARIQPWARQPLPQARAEFQRLDPALLWRAGPRARLSGAIELAPLDADSAATAPPGWQLNAQIRNDMAGAWDQQRLPLQQLQAQGRWQAQTLAIQNLSAQMAGGRLQAAGTWAAARADSASADSAAASATAPAAQSGQDARPWQIQIALTSINPALLHSALAADPIDGTASASVSVAGGPIRFEAKLQAHAEARAAAASGKPVFHLREASAQGTWRDGLLQLTQLHASAGDAVLEGKDLAVHTAERRAQGQARLTAPGLDISVAGQLAPTQGSGQADARLDDLARALAWAQTLPGAPAALQTLQAAGDARVQANWQGGWRDPALNAQLDIVQAQWQTAAAAENATPPVVLRDVAATLSGKPAQASLNLQAHAQQGALALKLNLQATGSQQPQRGQTARWQATLRQLEATLNTTATAPAPEGTLWNARLSAPVAMQLALPATGGLDLHTDAGELTLQAATTAASATDSGGAPARVVWEMVGWQNGALQSRGRLSGLPLAWADWLAGQRLRQLGVQSDLIFNGHWDIASGGEKPRVSAELERASGDLFMPADNGGNGRALAGVKTVRLGLSGQGQDVDLQLHWDSEHAGALQARMQTRLAWQRHADGGGSQSWHWPADAALQGHIAARLPSISVWSALAPPGWRIRGALAADVRVAGTRAAPDLNGSIAADGLSMRSVVDGLAFHHGRLRARLDNTRLMLDEFSLQGQRTGAGANQTPGGSLFASGQASLIDGQVQAHLVTKLDQLHASARADRSVSLSGIVQAQMTGQQEVQLRGSVRVDRAHIALPDESTPTLDNDVIVRGAQGQVGAGAKAASTAAQPPKAGVQTAGDGGSGSPGTRAPLQARVALDVDLGERFRVEGMGIDTRLAGALQISGSGPVGAEPKVNGLIRTEGGTFRAYSQHLNIAQGSVRFTGQMNNPALNILALRPIYQSDQKVGVQITGSALLPRVRLYAQPDMADTEKLAWLILGRAAPSGGAEAALLQQAALAVAGGEDGQSLASHFGLDELGMSQDNSGAATITVGKRLSDKLYATYGHSLASSIGSLFVYYELSRRWLVRGQAGLNPALDLIYSLSFD